MIAAHTARVRQQSGALGAACAALEDARDRAKRPEHGSFALLRRVLRLPIRLVFEFLILVVIALFELDTLRRLAASALVSRRR